MDHVTSIIKNFYLDLVGKAPGMVGWQDMVIFPPNNKGRDILPFKHIP